MEEVEEVAVRGESLIRALEEWAPPALAVERDPIGLQVGIPGEVTESWSRWT